MTPATRTRSATVSGRWRRGRGGRPALPTLSLDGRRPRLRRRGVAPARHRWTSTQPHHIAASVPVVSTERHRLGCTSASSGLAAARAQARPAPESARRTSSRLPAPLGQGDDPPALLVGGPLGGQAGERRLDRPAQFEQVDAPRRPGRRRSGRSRDRAGVRRPPSGCPDARRTRRSPGPGSPRAPTCGRRRTPGTASAPAAAGSPARGRRRAIASASRWRTWARPVSRGRDRTSD